MARITVEDCLENVENRFELVLVAAKRTRQLHLGADPLVPENRDKHTVIALREIAEGMVTNEILKEVEVDPRQELEEAFSPDTEEQVENDNGQREALDDTSMGLEEKPEKLEGIDTSAADFAATLADLIEAAPVAESPDASNEESEDATNTGIDTEEKSIN